jgi:hypothetical protein
MKAQFEDIEDIGIELTDDQISLVAGGNWCSCTYGTSTDSPVTHCGMSNGVQYCYWTHEGDED